MSAGTSQGHTCLDIAEGADGNKDQAATFKDPPSSQDEMENRK